MNREYAPYGVFIKPQTKCQVDLLGDTGTSVSRVAAFHLDYGIESLPRYIVYDFSRWSPCAWLPPPPGEYSSRYFRFFSALWNDSRVEGLMIMSDLAMRLGVRNIDQNPRRARSLVVRLGALCRDLP